MTENEEKWYYDEANRLFRIGTGLIHEFFPGTWKWMLLYQVFHKCIEQTESHMLEILKKAIDTGDFKNVDKTEKALSLDGEAVKLFEEYKDEFPLKTVLKRNPAHVKNFFSRCVDIGQKEFCRELMQAISLKYHKSKGANVQ